MTTITRIEVQQAGLLTLIVGRPRTSYRSLGVPEGGPLDRSAAAFANTLIGNPVDNPLLEITLNGPRLRFSSTSLIALSGADLQPTVDKEPIANNRPVPILEGSILEFGKAQSGCRCYLAIAGEWRTESWLGSQGALPLGHPLNSPIGILKVDDSIEIAARSGQRVPAHVSAPPIYPEGPIRMYPGPEFEVFTEEARNLFFHQPYRVSKDSSRMGYQLSGEAVSVPGTSEIISSAVFPGTIQMLPTGLPIILLADAQTTGGYSRIGQVCEADLDRLGQLKPGDSVAFDRLDPIG